MIRTDSPIGRRGEAAKSVSRAIVTHLYSTTRGLKIHQSSNQGLYKPQTGGPGKTTFLQTTEQLDEKLQHQRSQAYIPEAETMSSTTGVAKRGSIQPGDKGPKCLIQCSRTIG